MEIIRAEVKDLPFIVDMKMKMFREVGSITLLQDNAEELIQQTYASLYREDKCCHFIAYDENKKPFETGRMMYEKMGFLDSGEMEKWI